jgi:hypothetical protein
VKSQSIPCIRGHDFLALYRTLWSFMWFLIGSKPDLLIIWSKVEPRLVEHGDQLPTLILG